MTGKKLAELDVKPGDVVRYDGSYGDTPTAYIIAGWDRDNCYHTRQKMGGSKSMNSAACWEIVSRATDATHPRMTAAVEQLDAKDDGPDYNDGNWHVWSGEKRCPVHTESRIDHVWHDDNIKNAGITKDRLAGSASWGQTLKFRVIKPYAEPKRITVALMADFKEIGTIDLIDGQPDPDSIRLVEVSPDP